MHWVFVFVLVLSVPLLSGFQAAGAVISSVAVTEDLGIIERGGPSQIAVNPQTHLAYVTNPTEQKITVIRQEKEKSDGDEFPMMHVAATIEVPNAFGIAVNPLTNMIYVSGYAQSSVYAINGSNNRVTHVITAGDAPRGIAVNPSTNLIYVANFASDSISVIDDLTNEVIGTIGLSDGELRHGPHGLAIGTENNLLYVANWLSNSIFVIDLSTNQIVDRVTDVGTNPRTLVLHESEDKVYVANRDSISVVSVSENHKHSLVKQLPVGETLGKQYLVGGLALDVKASLVYFTNSVSNVTSAIDAMQDVILSDDLVNRAILNPQGVAIDTSLNVVYSVGQSSRSLMAFDRLNHQMHTIQIGGRPSSISLNPETEMLYVGSHDDAGTFSIMDGKEKNNMTDVFTFGQYILDVEATVRTNTVYVLMSTVEPDGFPKGTVVVIDAVTKQETDRIPISAAAPSSIAINSETNTIYVGHAGYNHNTVTIIDGATNKFSTSINTGYNYPAHLAVNEKLNKLYVAISEPATILIFDTKNGTMENSKPVEVKASGSLSGIAINSITDTVYVTDYWNATISIIDGKSGKLVETLTGFGLSPTGIALNDETGTVYVTDNSLNILMTLDGSTNKVISESVADESPLGVAVGSKSRSVYVTNTVSGTVLKYHESLILTAGQMVPFAIPAKLVSSTIEEEEDSEVTYSITGRSQNVKVTDILLEPDRNRVIISYTAMNNLDYGNVAGGIIELELPANVTRDIYGIWLGSNNLTNHAVATANDSVWMNDLWQDEEYYLTNPTLHYAYTRISDTSTTLKIVVPLEENSVELWATNIVPEFSSLFLVVVASIFSSLAVARFWEKNGKE